MTTTDFIAVMREDIKRELRMELLAELEPEIQRRLYANIFDIREAAGYLKVSESTLRKMVKAGEVPHFRQRGQIFFRQIDIDKHHERLVVKAAEGGVAVGSQHSRCSQSSHNIGSR